MSGGEARFTTGGTMRHVVVMTATGGLGLLAVFMVDAANLFYISLLGQEEMAAAIGFAGTFQFFMISVSIGLSIASTAVVSRAVGAGERERARRLAVSALIALVAVLCLIAALAWMFRGEALTALGATGRTHEIASRFLAIVLPALPLLGIGMVAGGLLRAVGDARRAMWVTLSGGLIAAMLDPLFIFGFGLGVDGAAMVSALSRLIFAAVGLWGVVRVHDLLGRPVPREFAQDVRLLLGIALPAVATQLSTPFGNAFLTRMMSEWGDEAVAGWAVVGRLSAVAFGAIYALSGAVGPILGQNWGAGLIPRIRMAYRDALIFSGAYVLAVSVALWLLTGPITRAFGVTGPGVEVIRAFTHFGAPAFLFSGWLFVSNAAFNNLGRPAWSTGFNWSRDAAVIPLLALAVGTGFGAAGVVMVQAGAALIVGTAGALAAWRFTGGLSPAEALPARAAARPQPAFASGRAALAVFSGDPPSGEGGEERLSTAGNRDTR